MRLNNRANVLNCFSVYVYSGAPLAYLTALSFRLFGVSLTTLVLPTALLAGLWVWLSWRLFHRLAGPRAGLAAALLCAFPDRLTSWYTHTPYNSYGAFLALGTLILWLAVEIEARDARGGRLVAWMALLGTAGGLAFWTNALIAPYLLAAGIPLLVHFRRHRFHPRLLAACLPGACGFMLAVSPIVMLALRRTASGTLDVKDALPLEQILALDGDALAARVIPCVQYLSSKRSSN